MLGKYVVENTAGNYSPGRGELKWSLRLSSGLLTLGSG